MGPLFMLIMGSANKAELIFWNEEDRQRVPVQGDPRRQGCYVLVAQTATTSLNTRSKKCSQSWCQKRPKKGAAACNPQALAKSLTWATTISSIHLLYFSLLGISLTCKKLELLNVDKLHIFRNITGIKYLRGTIGWGICGIDNIHDLHIMPASCNIFLGNLWGNKIFLKISDINFF